MGKHLIAQPQMVNTKMNYAQIISLEYFTNIKYLHRMEWVWKLFANTKDKQNMLHFHCDKHYREIYKVYTFKIH